MLATEEFLYVFHLDKSMHILNAENIMEVVT